MARYTGPVCRLCRRENEKLFLKGKRCFTEKCALERKAYPPGQHGTGRRRRRSSEYATQLREKQKVKRIYGVGEKQFRTLFTKAARGPARQRRLSTRVRTVPEGGSAARPAPARPRGRRRRRHSELPGVSRAGDFDRSGSAGHAGRARGRGGPQGQGSAQLAGCRLRQLHGPRARTAEPSGHPARRSGAADRRAVQQVIEAKRTCQQG